MSLQPVVIPTGGVQDAVAQSMADLKRRLAALEAARTTITVPLNSTPGPGSITSAMLADGAVTVGKLAANSVTATNIAANSITAAMIQANAVTAAAILAGAITAEKINAGAIEAIHISANAITAGDIAADAVTAGTIAAGAVTAGTVAAGAISTTSLAAGAVTAEKVNVATLSAITSNMGNITAGTITGGTVQTASSGSRVVMNSGGLTGYALDGTTKVFEINAGTGIASFTGIANIDPLSVIPATTLTGTLAGARLPSIGGANLLSNSNFENPTNALAGWAVYNDNLSPAAALTTTTLATGRIAGPTVARLTNSTDVTGSMGVVTPVGQMPMVVPGRDYTFSGYSQPVGSTSNVRVFIHWYTAAYAIIGSGTPGAVTTTPPDVWTRASVTGTAPPGAVYASCYIWVSNPASGLVNYIDGLQLEEGVVATAYAPRVGEILPGSIGEPEIAAGAVTTAKMTANTINGNVITGNTINGDKIISNSIQTLQLAAGSVKTNILDAGAVTAQKISLTFGGNNMLDNAGFMYIPAVGKPGYTHAGAPGYWQGYDNIPNEAGVTNTYSVLPYGGPSGIRNAWKLVTTGAHSVPKGFTSQVFKEQKADTWYTLSWFWKGNKPPQTASNVTRNSLEWILNPSASTTEWQQYAVRYKVAPDAAGALAGGGAWNFAFNFAADVTPWSPYCTSGTPTITHETAAPIAGAGSLRCQVSGLSTGSRPLYAYYNNLVAFDNQMFKMGGVQVKPVVATNGTFTAFNVYFRPLDINGSALGGSVLVWTQNAPVVGTTYTMPSEVTKKPGDFPAGTAFVGIDVVATINTTTNGGSFAFLLDSVNFKKGAFGDYAYIYPNYVAGVPGTDENYLADVSWTEGETLTAWSPKPDEILPGSVGPTQITPNSITTDQILAGGIHGDRITATTITANRLNVATLSAITADMGTLTAGTITGATVQTGTSGSRVRINSTGLTMFGTDGTTERVRMDTSTGNATFSQVKVKGMNMPFTDNTVAAIDSIVDWTNQTTSQRGGYISSFREANSGFPIMYLRAQKAAVAGATWAGVLIDAEMPASTSDFKRFRMYSGGIDVYNELGQTNVLLGQDGAMRATTSVYSGNFFRTTGTGTGWYDEATGVGLVGLSSEGPNSYNEKNLLATASGGRVARVASNAYFQAQHATNGPAEIQLAAYAGSLPGNAPAYPVVRCSHGSSIYMYFAINGTYSGYHSTSGWAGTSDENIKYNFRSLRNEEFLDKLRILPVCQYTWDFNEHMARYSAKDEVDGIYRPPEDGIGPTAQDFNAVFPELMSDPLDNPYADMSVNISDMAGVALAGVTALLDKVDRLERRLKELENPQP